RYRLVEQAWAALVHSLLSATPSWFEAREERAPHHEGYGRNDAPTALMVRRERSDPRTTRAWRHPSAGGPFRCLLRQPPLRIGFIGPHDPADQGVAHHILVVEAGNMHAFH